MLFHSFSYIAIFFPIVLILFFLCRRIGSPAASWIWLLIASLFFYGWGDLASIPILIASMVVNYAIGTRLQKYTTIKGPENSDSRRLLVLGLVFNIALLGFFKYTDFVVANVNWALTIRIALPDIMLPLAISFFTFQQITYLADSYRGEIEGRGWLEYVTYVAFFPKLLSGPIVRYNELVPQLRNLPASIDYRNASIGLLLFFIGLLKVTTAARVFGTWADNGFAHAASLSLIDGWTASLSYTFQIYFDFSGYIDMAMGSARFFNITLPINFDSPYRAVNIQDFWRRWHITLSRFFAGLSLYSPGRKQKRRRQYLRQYHNHFSYLRHMARCRLDVCHLGCDARNRNGASPVMADDENKNAFDSGGRDDLSFREHRLGFLQSSKHHRSAIGSRSDDRIQPRSRLYGSSRGSGIRNHRCRRQHRRCFCGTEHQPIG